MAQDEPVFNTWEELSVNPAYHEEIILDCQNDGYIEVLADLKSFESLKKLSLHNLTDLNKFPGIKASKEVSIQLCNSPSIQLSKFLKKISNKEVLQQLDLVDNNLSELPKILARFENLEAFTCSGNSDLELEDNWKVLNELSRITELVWTNNDATDLPGSISFYNRLQYLDLSNNGLIELPRITPSPLRNLKYLDLTDNIIVEMEGSLKNLGMRMIKDVYLDGEGLSSSEVTNIENLHSKAKFHFIDLDTAVNLSEDSILNALKRKDSLNKESGPEYGKLKLGNAEGTTIYSTAYLHYPKIFNHGKFKYTYDTTSFEGRYLSEEYENVRKILAGNEYKNLDLSIYPWNEKGEVWFEFGTRAYHWFFGWKTTSNSEMRYYMSRYNKEFNAFRNMVFVLQGEMTKKDFKLAYVKDKSYTDFRIYYDEGAGNFKLELKSLEGFQELYVYPRYKSKSQSLEKAQESYTKRYVRYSKYLQRRKAQFHKSMKKSKASYDKQYKIISQEAWKTFSNQYLSDEEKAMSRDEWLLYYDKVVANEKRALDNAEISLNHLKQSLLLSGYIESNLAALNFNHPSSSISNAFFTDEKNNRLPVVSYAIIDRKNKVFIPLEGGMGQGGNIVLKDLSHREFEIIVEMRNGDMGVVDPISYRKFELSGKELEKIEVEIYEKSLSHIGLFWDRINF